MEWEVAEDHWKNGIAVWMKRTNSSRIKLKVVRWSTDRNCQIYALKTLLRILSLHTWRLRTGKNTSILPNLIPTFSANCELKLLSHTNGTNRWVETMDCCGWSGTQGSRQTLSSGLMSGLLTRTAGRSLKSLLFHRSIIVCVNNTWSQQHLIAAWLLQHLNAAKMIRTY